MSIQNHSSKSRSVSLTGSRVTSASPNLYRKNAWRKVTRPYAEALTVINSQIILAHGYTKP